ncbi:hypothetical protein GCK72_007075 [Caenorhabditis remanei]|uniref:G-protein coupled receptors family 1 profile domain-containing protein n=1 Tax=Caenorhabditis remanei TaxID=31234 RepID=A0A6A5HKM7_CAERE|nr:hypothetical protein GCK72_007075 [Caenorhabditis remanei]KAF1767117.1 hypothetical protein GCK72_007075 [Caenorhabditis remanei]
MTTRLVICMAISYMISVLPLGVLYVHQALCQNNICSSEAFNMMLVTIVISSATTITHFPICFAISTQYRNTVKNFLGIKAKIELMKESKVTSSSNGT